MDLENKVERISEEFKSMRDELGQTRADLRAMLDMLGAPSPVGGPSTSGPGKPDSSAEEPSGGGLTISQGELAGVLAGAGPARRSQGLESMAKSIQEARSAGSGGPEMRMSLSDLAQMMKGFTAEMGSRSATTARPNGASAANGHKKGTSPKSFKREGSSSTPSLKDLARMMKSARSDGRPGVGTNRPKAASPARPDASSARRQVATPHGHQQHGVLDVNLVTNLIRWVGNVKRRLGVQHLQEVLELYQVTGHMAPVVEETIYRVASFSFVPDESDRFKTTHEDLIDAIHGLHGIVYGSRTAPVGPAVDFDIRETRVDSIVSEVQVEEASLEPDDESSDIEQGLPKEYGEALAAFRTAVMTPAVTKHKPLQAVVSHSAPKVESPPALVAETTSKGPTPVVEHSASANGVATTQGASISRRTHPSDLSDFEWDRIQALVPKQKPGGRPCKYDRREIMNGILYQMRNECSWRSLPANLPPWKIVHHYYRTWREDGTWESVYQALTGIETDSGSDETTSWDLSILTDGRGTDGGHVSQRPAMAETT